MEHDWATGIAAEILHYQAKCCDRAEKIELIAAYLRRERSRGQLMAASQYGQILAEQGASVMRAAD